MGTDGIALGASIIFSNVPKSDRDVHCRRGVMGVGGRRGQIRLWWCYYYYVPSLSILDTRKQAALSDIIASQLARRDHSRHILQLCQQPPEEALGSISIAPVRLNKDVQHNAVLTHGTLEIVLHALDPDEPT
jgi:hypothetical protein